jgi:hypothetical protein
MHTVFFCQKMDFVKRWIVAIRDMGILLKVSTFSTSHVVSDLSDRTSSYAWLISGSERMSAAAGMLEYVWRGECRTRI